MIWGAVKKEKGTFCFYSNKKENVMMRPRNFLVGWCYGEAIITSGLFFFK
jgi:hypothetical protein